uniref:ErfK/YbiS/YcfS/YnhG family protein n=1 Tax=Carnobacterium maltaromaticum TaxID=2751 RepID=A0A1Z5AX89_CARML|nr:toxin Cry1Ac domain D-VI-related protein [Carnobacterium maltaromaticum]CRI06667.1 ErfK/YbiS/YcfS/YnhG family protein [Carnobacterium maltaromaticum]
MKKMVGNITKKQKVIGLCVASVFLVGGGLVYANSTPKTVENTSVKAQGKQPSIDSYENNLLKVVNDSYKDEKREFLADGFDQKQVENIRTVLKTKIKESNKTKKVLGLEEQAQFAILMFNVETEYSNLFVSEGNLKENADVTLVTGLVEGLKKAKPVFYKERIMQIEEIKKEIEQTKEATDSVNSLFTDSTRTTIKEEITRDNYTEAKTKVDGLKDNEIKKTLSNALVNVDNHFIELEKANETQEKEEASQQTTTENTNSNNSTETQVSSGADSGTSSNPQTPTDNGNSNAPQAQGGIEGIVASSPSAQYTDQIIGVVASGSSAQVYLFEKNGGQWQTVLSTGGQVGSGGVGQASEYVSNTPKGSYGMSLAFGTGGNPGSPLPYRQITPNSYWISNVNDPQYNTWQERPSSDGADEHLASYPQQYQYAIALDYNGGVGGGSAFFLHVSNGAPTAGCIAVPLGVMQQLITRIHGGARIINVNSQAELGNY